MIEFEKDFATYCESSYCAGFASGLDALILALKAFNFEKGSEVIAPSNTYIATILAILQNDLKPVLVEPEIATYNIDPKKLLKKSLPKVPFILAIEKMKPPMDQWR